MLSHLQSFVETSLLMPRSYSSSPLSINVIGFEVLSVGPDQRAFGLDTSEEQDEVNASTSIWDILPQRSMSQHLTRVNTIEISTRPMDEKKPPGINEMRQSIHLHIHYHSDNIP